MKQDKVKRCLDGIGVRVLADVTLQALHYLLFLLLLLLLAATSLGKNTSTELIVVR